MFSRIIISLIILLALAACAIQPSTPAPIINGWKQNSADSSSYRVQSDDSIYSIAWTYGMDYKDLARYNNLSEPYAIHEGQILRMSPQAAAAPQSMAMATAVPSEPGFVSDSANANNSAQTEDNSDVNQSAITSQPPPPPSVQPNKTAPAPKLVLVPAPPVTKAAVTSVTPPAAVTTGVSAWVWPTKGAVVKKFSVANGSRGIDISGKSGQSVVAAASGKIVYAGSGLKGYGNLIIIKHNDNELSAYAFNKSLAVKEGDYVQSGQQIAKMGKDDSGKPLLHFEIRRDGKPVNPMTYLR